MTLPENAHGDFFVWVCLAYHFLTGFHIYFCPNGTNGSKMYWKIMVSSFGPTTRQNHTGPKSLRTIIKQWCGNLSLLQDDTCHRREVLDPRVRRLGTKAILGSRTGRPFVRVL